MLRRLANVIYWIGTGIGVICVILMIVIFINNGDTAAIILSGVFGAISYGIGVAVRYIVKGDTITFPRKISSPENVQSDAIVVTSKRALLARLWCGEVPLAVTYWVYGALISIVLRLLAPVLTYEMVANDSKLSPFDKLLISNAWFWTVIGYSLFISVAIWRSATKYAIQKPPSRTYGTLAKLAVVVGVISSIGAIVDFVSPSAEVQNKFHSTSIDEKMQIDATIAGLNADLPKKLDDISTLKKIAFHDNALFYIIESSIEIVDLQSFTTKMQEKLKSVCTDHDMIPVLQSNIDLVWVYSSPSNPHVASITIKKADCPSLLDKK